MTGDQHAVLESLHANTMSHNSVMSHGEPMQYRLDPSVSEAVAAAVAKLFTI